jgi:malonyl-CoA O-methyltransferase
MAETIQSHLLNGAKSSIAKSKKAAFSQQMGDILTQSKRRIASAFSKNVEYYERHASEQKESANRLAQLFRPLPDGEILEIGCGTGFLTKEIIETYPKHTLTSIDLSDEMVHYCKSHYPEVTFFQKDGEEIEEEQRYEAIFSGMCLHWFLNPVKGLKKIRKALRKGGVFYFSFPNERSYPEWKYFPLNRSLSVGLFLEEFGNVYFDEVEFTKEYAQPLAFLQEMKRLGVSTKIENRQNHLKDLIKVAKCEKMNPMILTTRITLGYCYV